MLSSLQASSRVDLEVTDQPEASPAFVDAVATMLIEAAKREIEEERSDRRSQQSGT